MSKILSLEHLSWVFLKVSKRVLYSFLNELFEFSKRNNFKHALACVHFSLMTPLFIKRQRGEHIAALFDSLKDRWNE